MNTKEYYSNQTVLNKMLPYLQNREVAFLQKIGTGYSFRNIKVTNAIHLKTHHVHFQIDKYPYKIYNSTAILKEMPVFSYNIPKRKEQSQEFHENFMNYIYSYDMVLDIDNNGDFKQCHEQTQRIIDCLEEEKICYYIKFSGSGFNLVIPHQHLGLAKQTEMQERFLKIAQAIQEIVDASLLDTTIYLMREVTKSLFSLDTTNDTVCMPLTKKEFQNFTHEIVEPQRMFEQDILKKEVTLNNKDTYNCLQKLEEYCGITTQENQEEDSQQDLSVI